MWLAGIVLKQIAKNSGKSYVKKHFSEIQLEIVDVEYTDAFGDYLIMFKDLNGKVYSCVIGPELFPISMEQGLMAIESEYEEHYK